MPMSPENVRSERGVTDVDQVSEQGRWQTPLTAVSWSYPCPELPKSISSLVYAKPPHYHRSLFHTSHSPNGSTSSDPQSHQANDLNPDLVGVKAAGDTTRPYEIDVGFYYADQFDDEWGLVSRREAQPSASSSQGYLCGGVGEEVMLNRERWHDLVRGLTYGVLDGDSSPTSAELHRSTSTLSSADLTDSERSAVSNSIPSTPKPKGSHTHVAVNDQSPASSDSEQLCRHRRVTSRLNASASSFVPTSITPEKAYTSFRPSPSPSITSLSSPSPTSTDFPVPSPNSSVSSTQSHSPPSTVLEKDEHGFYNEVVFPRFHGSARPFQRPFFARLPPFLRDPLRRSKTRTIVDGLRVLGAHASKAKSVGPSPSSSPSNSAFNDLDVDFLKPRLSVSEDGGDLRSDLASDAEEDEGWIRPDTSEDDLEGKAGKAQRTRDLCLALGRNRAGSRAGGERGEEGKDDDVDLGYLFLKQRSALYSQASSSSPGLDGPELTSSNDGWIEGPPLPASRPRKHRSGNYLSPNPGVPFHSLSSQMATNLPKPQTCFATIPVSVQPTPYFPVPMAYPTYAHPYAATAGYMRMQMHIQSQLQLQMQMQTYPWFQLAAQSVPLVPTHTVAPRFTNPQVCNRISSDRGGITGVSGVRHAIG